jgi:RHS repeat-associated protein
MTYRLTDGLGSTINLCDAEGAVLVTDAYDAFGGIRSQTGTSANYWQFTGEQRDGESGFDYLRARYYDPELGRFLSQDPVREGSNYYSYALGNPVSFSDPSGKAAWVTPWEGATYADTLLFFIAQVQVEAGEHIDEGLFEYFESSGAMGVLLIYGPIERCYHDFALCSVRNGFVVPWLPEPSPDPLALYVCQLGLDDCRSAKVCQYSGCTYHEDEAASAICRMRYCCVVDCADNLPLTPPWQCGLGIFNLFLGAGALATTPEIGGWGAAFGVGGIFTGTVLTYDSCI